VIHAIQTINDLLKTDKEIKNAVTDLGRQFNVKGKR
jgi:hypothetical protein